MQNGQAIMGQMGPALGRQILLGPPLGKKAGDSDDQILSSILGVVGSVGGSMLMPGVGTAAGGFIGSQLGRQIGSFF